MKFLVFTVSFIVSIFVSSSNSFAFDGCAPVIENNKKLLHCKMMVGDYPRPVHFYIPESIETSISLKVLLHFHGHNLNGYDHFYNTAKPGDGYGDYGAFLQNSKINGIVIIPESLGNCKTYDMFFAKEESASNFFNGLEFIIKKHISNFDQQWIISGHSGAYRVVNQLAGYLNLPKTKVKKEIIGIGLFDATYGDVSNIELWVKKKIKRNEDFIFYNSYILGANSTAANGSVVLGRKLSFYHLENIILKPINGSTDKSALDLHFSVLKNGGLTEFWSQFKFEYILKNR